MSEQKLKIPKRRRLLQKKPNDRDCDENDVNNAYLCDTEGYALDNLHYYKIRIPDGREIQTRPRLNNYVDLVIGPAGSSDRFFLREESWRTEAVTEVHLKKVNYEVDYYLDPNERTGIVFAMWQDFGAQDNHFVIRGRRVGGRNFIGYLNEGERYDFSLGTYDTDTSLNTIALSRSSDLTFEVEFVCVSEKV
ncbi:hypothetical protein DPV78_007393 [Talaromyces pinophilus]|nr:hypothetical protein DPV78_007393 [Talaromyces pinophilus]PCG93353.1 Hypothetical protein PENO1_083900 [Penicillium occitanis (nom. inval.)]PCG93551.1 hypothetical protein PENOC_087050 [Penicillium occitanis (nom. inval.)]